MNCPICAGKLKNVNYEADIMVDECPMCKGIWLDTGELEKIQTNAQKNHKEKYSQFESYTEIGARMSDQMGKKNINCPKCNNSMTKKEFQPTSTIIVDLCNSCKGLWLDAGELQQLEVFLEEHNLRHPKDANTGLLSRFVKLFFK